MATEALRAPGKPDGINPIDSRPNHANIPNELINPSPNDSEKRGRFSENRVKELIISQTDIIKTAILNKPNGSEDTLGHDITVHLKGDPPVKVVHIQVKSRKEAITAFKQKIRDKYFPESANYTELEKSEIVKKWLTEHNIILINGSQIKTDDNILNDSFYPQLERIQQKALMEQTPESTGQMRLFPRYNQIQIFPELI